MSAFASPEAAAVVEEALALPQHDAIRSLVHAAVVAEREEIILAMAEALVTARTHAAAQALASENAASDDLLASWHWGETPRFDDASKRIGIAILVGRRRLLLWLPLNDILAMTSSFIADRLRADLSRHLSPVAEDPRA